jgi:dihydrofolate synthase/folylpolyglutamate synthase
MAESDLQSFNEYLQKITERGMRHGLEGMSAALEKLGHPEKNYPIIHIAGTNGKGSTCSFLAQILFACGLRTGLTLSPHVEEYRERIQIDNTLISEPDLLSVHQFLHAHLNDQLGLTYFEWTTLLALAAFEREKVDLAILETGLGGRWDATNACPSVLTAITTIGLDHVAILGETHEKILAEKLAIIKEGQDFLFCPTDQALIQQAKTACAISRARFHHVRDFDSEINPLLKQFSLRPGNADLSGYLQENLRCAFALSLLLHQQGRAPHPRTIIDQLNLTPPPGRCQIIQKNPLVIVDVAHNREGLLALKNTLQERGITDYTLIFGCLADRDFQELAGLICSPSTNYWVRFEAGQRTTSAEIYQTIQKTYGGEVIDLSAQSVAMFCRQTFQKPIVVCGSFYLCGPFLSHWRSLCIKKF